MPPSIIPKHGKKDDQATPVSRVYYREGYYSSYVVVPGGWENLGMFPWTKQIESPFEPKISNE